jgi:hypothetical protein
MFEVAGEGGGCDEEGEEGEKAAHAFDGQRRNGGTL